LLAELNQAYEAGELDGLKSSILPFLRVNQKRLHSFVLSFMDQNGEQTLEFMVKYFILSFNMPFDMKSYMDSQSQAIKKDIDLATPEKRTALVSEWIKEKAAIFREHSIMQQIYCFDKMKGELIPIIHEEFDLPIR